MMYGEDRERLEPDRPVHGRAAREVSDSVSAPQSAPQSGPLDLLSLQRLAGNSAVSRMLEEDEQESQSGPHAQVLDVVSSGGQPLPADTRAEMESKLGQDFSDVRVHTDGAAQESAAGVQANAYTVGSHIAFADGAYDPSSDAGRTTLAHELTHVVQQRSGPVDGTPAGGGIAVSDPGDRFERQAAATAEQVMQREVAPGVDEDEDLDEEQLRALQEGGA
jgi:Domain of unknown function (DUF4157)